MKTKILVFAALIAGVTVSSSAQIHLQDGRATSSHPVQSNSTDAALIYNHQPLVTSDSDVPGAKDSLVNDDLLVTGSLGVGFDVVNGEAFGFNTILLKENNLRIKFDDTSLTAGFPANDWTLVANESASGGLNYFAIEDATAAVIPFKLMAGAPLNALFIDSTGHVGLSTTNPGLELHMKSGDTPGIRFEQDNTLGWTAQTWDVAGNESNFFVRDVTNGSLLPFRIAPGAPTNSIYVGTTGNVGLGVYSPSVRLHVHGAMRLDTLLTAPAANEGAIFMDGASHQLKYHDGTQWNTITPDTDEQDLVAATLTGTTLQIDIENGASVTVDLHPLIADLEARVTALEAALGLKEAGAEHAAISQNVPNPFNTKTNIPYFIPADVLSASLAVYNVKGEKIKEFPLSNRGAGTLVISEEDLAAGSYFYALILDGTKSEPKIMIKTE